MPTFEIIDAVQRSLENEGVLQSIRLQLRTSVLRVISNAGAKSHREDTPGNFKDIPNGDIVVGLIADALDALHLKETKLIFQAEAGIRESGRQFLSEKLQLNIPAGSIPVLSSLIEANRNTHDTLVRRDNSVDSLVVSGNIDAKEVDNRFSAHDFMNNSKTTPLVKYNEKQNASKYSDSEIIEDVKEDMEAVHSASCGHEEGNRVRGGHDRDPSSPAINVRGDDDAQADVDNHRAFVSEPLYSQNNIAAISAKTIQVASSEYESHRDVEEQRAAQPRAHFRTNVSKASPGGVTRSTTGWEKSASPQIGDHVSDGEMFLDEQSFDSNRSPMAPGDLKVEVDPFHQNSSFEKDYSETAIGHSKDLLSCSVSHAHRKLNSNTNSLFEPTDADHGFGGQENEDDEEYEDENFEDVVHKSETASSIIEEEYSFEQGSDSEQEEEEEEETNRGAKQNLLANNDTDGGSSTMFKMRSGLLPLASKSLTASVDDASVYSREQDQSPHRKPKYAAVEDEEDSVASEDLNAISVGENQSDSEDMSF